LNINKPLNLITMLLLRQKVREQIPPIKVIMERPFMVTCNIPRFRGTPLITILCIRPCLTLRTGMITFLIILVPHKATVLL
jgi:hypothetical protein